MPIFPVILALAGVGFVVAIIRAGTKLQSGGYYIIPGVPPPPAEKLIVYEPPTSSGGGYMPYTTIPSWLTSEILASARKWAAARGVPLQEILATIWVESRGKPRGWNCQPGPKPDGCTKENSRGLMQININPTAWGPLLTKYGLVPDDLYDIDTNIKLGSEIYASYRKKVQNLIALSGVPQTLDLATLTRLYYKGPKYVERKLLAHEDAVHPYRDAELAVANWQGAIAKVSNIV
jgi:hypothetical protein